MIVMQVMLISVVIVFLLCQLPQAVQGLYIVYLEVSDSIDGKVNVAHIIYISHRHTHNHTSPISQVDNRLFVDLKDLIFRLKTDNDRRSSDYWICRMIIASVRQCYVKRISTQCYTLLIGEVETNKHT